MRLRKSKKSLHAVKDVLPAPRPDRRKLSNVPDAEHRRSLIDRRGEALLHEKQSLPAEEVIESNKAGIRYQVDYAAAVTLHLPGQKKQGFTARIRDISGTGVLLALKNTQQQALLEAAEKVSIKFEITPGSMPEGYEMRVDTEVQPIRFHQSKDGSVACGLVFKTPLGEYAAKHKDRYALAISGVLLFFIVGFTVLMRMESVLYFEFNKLLYLYSIITAVFLLSRYLFGALYRPEPIDMDFTPGVSIIIPCFNEEEWIHKTILSCINQDYPIDKLEVIVVDDCSNDGSVDAVKRTIDDLLKEEARFHTAGRIKYFVQPQNRGKRDALARGVLEAKHELVVFVDSDSFLDPYAIRNIVVPFKDPKMGGVAGRTEVANTYTNVLTKMQSVRYYIAFRMMKAAEAYFDAVTCLSGPLSCYRKDIVLEHLDEWLNQKFLGRRATFGDDRSMTNFVLRSHRTGYQDSAVCSTIVPNRYRVFLKQQMRWKRSWLRESILAGTFMWKKEPFMSVLFYIGLCVPVAAPVVVLYNLIYVPLFYRVFPTTFLMGMLMMALLMSFVQLFLKKSSTWIFGMVFCVFYEAVLLWQMPIAWFTFWKSTWGTRLTPEDIADGQRKAARKKKRRAFGRGTKNEEEAGDKHDETTTSI